MKELTFPKNIKIEEFGIEVKPYLTVEEIATIADSVMSNTNYITKQKARDLGVLAICTDIEEVKEEDYDLYVATGLVDAVLSNVSNIRTISDTVNDEYNVGESLTMIATKFQNIENRVGMIEDKFSDFIDNATKTMESVNKKLPSKKILTDMLGNFSKVSANESK